MATTYFPTLLTGKDRVRRLVGDVVAKFDFQDEEIGYELGQAGFIGNPITDETGRQDRPELVAAIRLLESRPAPIAGTQNTIKQGSIVRTKPVLDYASVLVRLQQQLAAIDGASYGANGGVSVASPNYSDVDPRLGPNYRPMIGPWGS